MTDLGQQTAQELGAALHLRGQRAWNARVDELVRRADALEAAEKERDETMERLVRITRAFNKGGDTTLLLRATEARVRDLLAELVAVREERDQAREELAAMMEAVSSGIGPLAAIRDQIASGDYGGSSFLCDCTKDGMLPWPEHDPDCRGRCYASLEDSSPTSENG